MTDYYNILGVAETASPDEIKKAYRSLANKHHPDKGGDQAKFKDISVAYDTLSDPQKKAEYDAQRNNPFGNGAQFHFHGGPGGFDPFAQMFGGGHSPFGDIFGNMRGHVRRNRDLNISCIITFMDSFHGKELEANYRMPSGRNQTANINIPPGIRHGDTIRFSNLGDDSISNLPRGNLNVTIQVQPDPDYQRVNDDVVYTLNINPIEAIIGCRKSVKTLGGQNIDLDIRAGVETGVEFAAMGHGFTNPSTGQRGRFVSVIKIKTPTITDPGLIARLKDINNEVSRFK